MPKSPRAGMKRSKEGERDGRKERKVFIAW